MLTMSLKLEGLPETKAMLGRVKRVLNDMRPALTSAGEYLLQVFSVEAFESEGSIYGRPWPRLQPAYSLLKSQRYPGRGILERTGELRKGFRLSVGATHALIANAVPHGKYHQLGQGVPQRIIVALEKRQRDGVETRVRANVMERLRRAV